MLTGMQGGGGDPADRSELRTDLMLMQASVTDDLECSNTG